MASLGMEGGCSVTYLSMVVAVKWGQGEMAGCLAMYSMAIPNSGDLCNNT